MIAFILTINGGSSSLKCAIYVVGSDGSPSATARVERIGHSAATIFTRLGRDSPDAPCPLSADDHASALGAVLRWLDARIGLRSIVAVGHRVVHGGEKYSASQRIMPELIDDLKKLAALDPDHLPGEIALIEACASQLPHVPQVACFDTAFYHDLPRVAQVLPVPRRYEAAGVRRYGFHGLSYTYLLGELERQAGVAMARGRVVLAHLGAGSSMAAIHNKRCLDTTMAFTPTAGLMMATRSGDLDPGVLIYLMRQEKLNADAIDELVNHRSGLLGVSETSADMRDLLAHEASDVRAVEAIALFCYQIKKQLGAYAAVLGGLETVVFAGGIGENAPAVRARICEGLKFLGIAIASDRNAAGAAVISPDASRCTVRVIPTNEELIILREVERLVPEAMSSESEP